MFLVSIRFGPAGTPSRTDFKFAPKVCGQEIDLHALYKTVTAAGGSGKVSWNDFLFKSSLSVSSLLDPAVFDRTHLKCSPFAVKANLQPVLIHVARSSRNHLLWTFSIYSLELRYENLSRDFGE